MDKLDRRILKALQNDFPLCQRPYDIIADKLNIPCRRLWDKIQKLTAEGLIRRIGASLNSGKLGFCSTLAAVSVPSGAVERAAELINSFSEVTHCYLRKDRFNIWFTIIAANHERIDDILGQIRSGLSLESSQVLNVPGKRLFKLDTRFTLPV